MAMKEATMTEVFTERDLAEAYESLNSASFKDVLSVPTTMLPIRSKK